MNTKSLILEQLSESCRSLNRIDLLIGDVKWDDVQLIRKCGIRAHRGDPMGWQDFITHLKTHHAVACGFIRIFEELGWADYSIETGRMELTLPPELSGLDAASRNDLISFLNLSLQVEDEQPATQELGRIMYIEEKPGLAGHARIGRVTFSGSRKTIYYVGRKLQSLKGTGYKANYINIETGLEYWISNCKKDGNDTLYPGIVEIDNDAREEYWTAIRKKPENVHLTRFRSEGKYAKRRPS
jgi:hypothetical protein